MKLSNIFKKATKTSPKTNVQALDKKQLEKVIGGADTPVTTVTKTNEPFSEVWNQPLRG